MNRFCETCAYNGLQYYRAYKCSYCRSVYDDTGDAPEYVDANGVSDVDIWIACIDGTCLNAQEHEEWYCPMPCADGLLQGRCGLCRT